MKNTKTPKGYNTINAFIITKDARKHIEFLKEVFGAEEDLAGHTVDTDGLLLHSELVIGNSRVMVADTKPGWPFTPSLLQVYVDNVESTLEKAEKLGARIITKPTEFFGDIFSRMIDPWNNLWWVYEHRPQSEVQEVQWDENDNVWEPTEELQYIHRTLLEAMKSLNN